MTFAPALTWMHLFPPEVSFDCKAAPAWFQDVQRPFAPAGRSNIQIAFERNLSGWAESSPLADGLVAVNCSGLDPARLAAAGFHYVRAFAAFPNIAAARWFIPLDSGSVSSAAFRLYSPTRKSARLKKNAVRVLARTSLPLWYRDTVWIVQREKPPLEQMIAGALPEIPVRLALSAGAPEPARNRKASAALLGLDGSILAFAKISGSPLARRLLRNEATSLQLLANKMEIRDCVPRLLASGNLDDRFVLIESPVSGAAAPARITPAHRAFLRVLESSEFKPAAQTTLVAKLPARLAGAGAAAVGLQPLLDQVVTSLDGCLVPSTFVHGDFAPWNLRSRKNLVACFDWEYGQADGLPLFDETHHEFQVGYLIKKWTVGQAAQRFDEIAASNSRWMPRHVAAIQNLYLIDVLARKAEEGYSATDPMAQWTRALLQRRIACHPTQATGLSLPWLDRSMSAQVFGVSPSTARGTAAVTGPVVIATLRRPHGSTGVRMHTAALREGLKAHGVPCAVITPVEAGLHWSALRAIRPFVVNRCCPSKSLAWSRRCQGAALQANLTRYLVSNDVAHIIAQCPVSAQAAMDARAAQGKWAKLRITLACHFNQSEAHEYRILGQLNKPADYRRMEEFEANVLRGVDQVVFMSEWARQVVEQDRCIVLKSSVVIPTGIACLAETARTLSRAEIGAGPEDFLLMNVGALDQRKNQLGLLNLFAALASREPRTKLVLVGDGPERPAIVGKAAALGLSPRVLLLGDRLDVSALLPLADLYVHFSTCENCPTVILKAARAGLPWAAIPAAGMAELQRSLGGCLPINPYDLPQSASEILRVIDDPALGALLGAEARGNFLQHYTEPGMIDAYLDILAGTSRAQVQNEVAA